ncbi:MAG: aminotransferase class I/II-fold pyridoxal phosphate-dependent enzyme [Reichenbachiella sp.]|uniref:DegT/DnrJ/EryC1/StrS family aminotransferase n=1 Tax=Reichenbachiella sp. TaxID=2184521 RepID=UPI002966E4E7|nr:aminotransferase class I/II-fold pyridoxal phosphate-dependent enzyme [Reichenbachiella sp.]MDW3209415.1 aminotransferase class I/II-fold pyridoxal phosphate-dependent enzyme [Reichenbachiella sp.]
MNKRIYLSPPHMSGEEKKYMNEAFDSNWIAPIGPNVDEFENAICDYTGSRNCAALSSGTAAIHLALILLGVQQGDEVIASTFTFAATINPIIYQKATPVLVESEPESWNLSPEFLEEAISDRIAAGKKPKAIIFVHIYGMPGKVEDILSIARKYDIPLIEDASEAFGSKYKGIMLGTFGDLGIYSFNGNKIITTSGGGALVSNNKDWIDRAIHLATQARDEAPHYQHTEIGYNYRLSNVLAGIGRGQMQVIEERVSKRRTVNQFYRKHLDSLPGVQFLSEPTSDYFSNHWLTTMLIDPEQSSGVTTESVRTKLAEHNIEARPFWKPMHLQPVFDSYPYYGDGFSERLFEKGLCLPSGSSLSEDDQLRIVGIVKELFSSK